MLLLSGVLSPTTTLIKHSLVSTTPLRLQRLELLVDYVFDLLMSVLGIVVDECVVYVVPMSMIFNLSLRYNRCLILGCEPRISEPSSIICAARCYLQEFLFYELLLLHVHNLLLLLVKRSIPVQISQPLLREDISRIHLPQYTCV